MRPERLELEGFTVFREPTEVHFAGAELFALTGPTGAGKSSLIDAITFALYGTVPRYSDLRRIEPVIAQGAVEARIRLDFSVGGVGYSAVRVARQGSRGGASTKEARLERGDGEILASDADSVSEQVERLLGLSYRHFTTCVVLPQGEFARFLHEKPGKRQDLLVQLLDLGVYERMAQSARQRASAAEAKLASIEQQLSGLVEATEQSLRDMERRGRDIDGVVSRIDAEKPRLDELREKISAARATQELHEQLAVALTSVHVPEAVVQLGAEITQSHETLTAADAASRTANAALDALEAQDDLADKRAQLERAQQLHSDQKAAREALAVHDKQTAALADTAARASTAREKASEALAKAQRSREEARLSERALELAGKLGVGDDCPVCGQTVAQLRDHPHSGALSEAEGAVASAEATLAEASRAAEGAMRANDRHQSRRSDAAERLAERTAQIASAPSLDEIAKGLKAADAYAAKVAATRTTARERTADLRKAQDAARAVASRQSDLRGDLDRARGRVAAIDPPASSHANLADDWHVFADWARTQVTVQQKVATDGATAQKDLAAERDTIGRTLTEACEALGIDVRSGSAREAAAVEHARLGERVEVARSALQRRRALLDEQRAERERHRVADALGSHLSANRFEKWVLDEAMGRLVERASEILHGLTAEAYSLKVDAKRAGFEVIDHTNADMTRSVRTLSGGETFLASLALALALADQIADLAPDNAPRLESIFLDEGFGSLDLDTLDTVAAALEELGAQGRMVGVVSHIPELAERLPTRFEVRKEGASATVTRVDR